MALNEDACAVSASVFASDEVCWVSDGIPTFIFGVERPTLERAARPVPILGPKQHRGRALGCRPGRMAHLRSPSYSGSRSVLLRAVAVGATVPVSGDEYVQSLTIILVADEAKLIVSGEPTTNSYSNDTTVARIGSTTAPLGNEDMTYGSQT